MGLLDDAIREHLELKRRRGADSAEIARQEREAFGGGRPVEVEPALDEPAAFAAEEAAAAPTTLHAVEPEPPAHHEHAAKLAEPPRPHGDPADHLPHVEEAPVQEHRVVEPPASVSQPTREFDPDELRAATAGEPEAPVAPARPEDPSAEGEEGDVLEETPEFLQETPEHDRLWFEQRPPRDFDF